jgi:hypothetical protein
MEKTSPKPTGIHWAHYQGSKDIICRGRFDACLRFLTDRFLRGDYEDGHIKISKVKPAPKRRRKPKFAPTPEDEGLPADHFLD